VCSAYTSVSFIQQPDQYLLKHSLNEHLELVKMSQQIRIQVK